MAKDHAAVVEQGLRLKKAGNAVMTLVGGRSIHPVNVRVGGFYRLPDPRELRTLVPALEKARLDALATVELVSGFEFPQFEQPYEYVALRPESGYPLDGGLVTTSGGLAFPAREFPDHVHEEQVGHSHALQSRLNGDQYVVGPLARFSLNFDRLSPLARDAATTAGLGPECRNPFRSIVVRAVELVYACDEALRLIASWQGADRPYVDVPPREGVGHGVTEAPRGLLYHRYTLDNDGLIHDATIVPPTSQNQASIESDLRWFVQDRLDLSDDELTRQCEQAIRNYDPCISCATHFLDLTVERV
jgi:coenzyme F420-reducing hydrogenase alpha subunit